MFENEQEFSRFIIAALGGHSHVTRIESHGTVVGIPDIFVANAGKQFWLELKNDNTFTGAGRVHWRPGQQAWYYNYYTAMQKKQWVLTLVAGKEDIYFIRNNCIYTNSYVEVSVESLSRMQYLDIHNAHLFADFCYTLATDTAMTTPKYLANINSSR